MRTILLFLSILSGGITVLAQQRSPFQEENIFYAGKIWGFVKYYHPEARVEKFDMDSLLVVLLDNVAEAKDLKQRNAVFNNWVAQFGKINTFEPLVIKDSSQYKQLYDYSWLTNKTFDKKLSETLIKIKDAKRADKSRYITFSIFGIPSFENEKYIEPDFSQKHQRLLPLMRYWNIIEYYFPYKYLTDKKWDDVLKEYIPLFLHAKEQRDLNKAYVTLITKTNDGHSCFRDMTAQNLHLEVPTYKYFPQVLLLYSNGKFFVKGLRQATENTGNISDYGFEIGDEIIAINGKNPQEIIKTNFSDYFSASNFDFLCHNTANYLLCSDTTFVDVSYQRNGAVFSGKVTTEVLKFKQTPPTTNEKITFTTDSIAYLNMEEISSDEIYEILHKIRKTKGLIVDMRGYPDSPVSYALSAFINPLSQVASKSSNVIQKQPGIFKLTDGINDNTGYFNPLYYNGKVVVLVNSNTVSASEFSTMKLQTAPGVTTIGSQTAGVDGNVVFIPLQQGIEVGFSAIGIYYPNGGETQRVGIQLDEEVYPTPQGIREGRDNVRERAIEIIRSQRPYAPYELYYKALETKTATIHK